MDFDIKKESITDYCSRKNNLLLTNFIDVKEKFPFYNEVYNRLKQKYFDYDTWTTNLKNYEFIKILLDITEFDFANKPKAILPFHQYTNHIVTPIEEHIKDKIFDMFFRGNEYSSGSGLGLYISRIASKKLHGSIDLISASKGFTEFNVKLGVIKEKKYV